MTKNYIQNNNLKAQDKLKLSIKFFILIGFLMTSIVTVSYNYFVKATLNNTVDYNMELVRNVSTSIDDYLSDIEKDLKVLSISKEIQSIADGQDIDTIENLLKRFEEYSKVHDEVKNIYFATPNKKTYIYPYSKKSESIDLTERPYYVDAVNTKDYVWSDNLINKATGDMVKIVARAIFKNNQLVGVLGIQIDLSIIEEKLKNASFGETGYMMLLDEEGRALLHPSKEVIGNILEIDGLKQTIQREDGMASFISSWNGTEKVMFCSKTNKGNFIVLGSVVENELLNYKRLLAMLIMLSIISTIILTICSLVISIAYSKKQEKYVDKQQIVRDNYKKSDDLKDKLDRLKDYKSNGTLTKEEYEVKREDIIKNHEI